MNSLLLCVFLLVNYSYAYITSSGECLTRESGACKVWTLNKVYQRAAVNTLGELPPVGYQLYTSLEVHYVANKHSYINNMIVEQTTPTYYDLDNGAVVSIKVEGHNITGSPTDTFYYAFLKINIGKKFYSLATFEYRDVRDGSIKKYNHYTPDLPTFPYILHLEITTNGKFSIYTKGQTEPFFQHELGEEFIADTIEMAQITSPTSERPMLAAFYDCSIKNKPNCGTFYKESLYDCREKYENGQLQSLYGARNITYFARNENIIFDEYFVVYNTDESSMAFSADLDTNETVFIDFHQNAVEIGVEVDDFNTKVRRTVRTTQWLEFPASPYFVRIIITNGTDDDFIHLIDMRNETVLKLNLCGNFPVLTYLELHGKIYFDCLRSPSEWNRNQRGRKSFNNDFSAATTIYDEMGFNFTKSFFYKDKSLEEPLFTYTYNSIASNEDWCKRQPLSE